LSNVELRLELAGRVGEATAAPSALAAERLSFSASSATLRSICFASTSRSFDGQLGGGGDVGQQDAQRVRLLERRAVGGRLVGAELAAQQLDDARSLRLASSSFLSRQGEQETSAAAEGERSAWQAARSCQADEE
jgi:hypothetical protein